MAEKMTAEKMTDDEVKEFHKKVEKLSNLSPEEQATAIANLKEDFARAKILLSSPSGEGEKSLKDLSWELQENNPSDDDVGACGFKVGNVIHCCNLTEAQCGRIPKSMFEANKLCPPEP